MANGVMDARRSCGLSALESVPSGPVTWPDLRGGVSASDRERPLFTGGKWPANGPVDRGPACSDGRALVLPRPPRWLPSLGPCPPCQGSRSGRVRLGLDTTDSAETIEQRGGRASATLTSARGWDAGRRSP